MPDPVLPLSSVRELKAFDNAGGQAFASLLVVRKLAAKTASNGNPFYSVDLGDRTGSFGCTIFSDHPAFELLKAAGEGSVVRVEGRIDYYQGRLSPKLGRLVVLSETELGAPGVLDNLVEVAPENADALWQEFNGFIESISQPELRATTGRSSMKSATPFAGRRRRSQCTTPIATACSSIRFTWHGPAVRCCLFTLRWMAIWPWRGFFCTTRARPSNTKGRSRPNAAAGGFAVRLRRTA